MIVGSVRIVVALESTSDGVLSPILLTAVTRASTSAEKARLKVSPRRLDIGITHEREVTVVEREPSQLTRSYLKEHRESFTSIL